MRAAKDGLPTHSGDSEELEDPRWTHAVGAIMEAYFGERRNTDCSRCASAVWYYTGNSH